MKRVFAFIGFTEAIVLIVLNIAGISLCKYLICAAAVLLIISLLLKKIRQAKVLPVVFASALFACLIFMAVTYNAVVPAGNLDGKTLDTTFEITDIYDVSDSGRYVYTVKTKTIDDISAPQNIKVKLYSNEKIDADYYQQVNAQFSFFSNADNGFASYGNYGNGIYVCASITDCDVQDSFRKPPNFYIINLRLKIKDILNENLSDEVSALAVSIFTGDTSELSDEIRSNFKICGVSHALAVSGLHVSVVCLGIYYFLKIINCPKKLRIVASLLFLFVYIGVADFRKSVVRAGIMMSVMLISQLINIHSDTLNSLGFAVFIICLNPFAVTDVSALLTVCAVLGITVVMPELEKLCTFKNKVITYICKTVMVSFSVTLTTLPVLWLFFKSVSIMGIIINIIFIPLVQIALVSVFLFCIFTFAGLPAVLTKFTADFSLRLMIKITDFSAEHFSYLLLDLSGKLFGIAIAAILLYIALNLIIFKTVNSKLIAAFFAVVFAVSSCVNFYNISTQTYFCIAENGGVIVYDSDNLVAVDIDNNSDKYLLEKALLRKKDNVILINCFEFEDCDNAVLINDNEDFSITVDKNLKISRDCNEIIIYIFNKNFKVSDNCVTIGEEKIYRDIYGRFGEEGNVVLTVTVKGTVTAEREKYG